MTITVITVCYNSAATIRKTIESVLGQTTKPFEHIIVDGKSSDDTISIVSTYEKSYHQNGINLKIISEPDEGYYDAMNKGIHNSKGDIIGILNSDDWYESEALKHVTQYSDSNPDSGIFMGDILIHNGDQIIHKRARFDKLYQTSRHFNHPAMFARKGVYAKVGDYRNENVHNDYGWYLRAIKMGMKVTIIPEVLTNFTIGGVSSQKKFSNTIKRIKLKYRVYRQNGYSRLYIVECTGQELAKYLLVKDKKRKG